VADEEEDVGVGHNVLGVGHTHIGLGLVIERHELDLEAHLLQGALELVNGQLGPQLDPLPQGGLLPREGALGGDLDGPLLLGPGRRPGQQRHPCGQRNQHPYESTLHHSSLPCSAVTP